MNGRRPSDALPLDSPGITDPNDWEKLEAALRETADVQALDLRPFDRITAPYLYLCYYLLQDDGADRQREGTRAWLCSRIMSALQAIDDSASTEAAVACAFNAGRLVERLLVKLAVEPLAVRGIKAERAVAVAATTKHETAECDGATLARRFERLQAAHDDGDIYELLIAELKTRKVKLKRPMKLTRAAVARKIQRYRAPLR
jgi:hypothetical protein